MNCVRGETMRAQIRMTAYIKAFIFLFLMISTFALPEWLYATTPAPMGNYCIVPPYVKRNLRPNVMIMMDNTYNMGDQAYTGMTDYVPSNTYQGYFKPNLMYYNLSNTWIPAGTMPATCTPPSCVYISGNILNWATTSKYDLLENILVGGISASKQTNVNEIISFSTSWTKVLNYTDSDGNARTCYFIVIGGNLNISDDPDNGGSCGYLDSPAKPLPKDYPDYPQVSAIEPKTEFAEDRPQDRAANVGTKLLESAIRKSLGIISFVIDLFASDAEADSNQLLIGIGSPPPGTLCAPYSPFTINAAGGSGSGYTWSVSSGSLPPGLSLDQSGTPGSAIISGTPTYDSACSSYPCSYTFTLDVHDDQGTGGKNDSKQNYTMTINAGVSIIIPPPPAPQTPPIPLPGGNQNIWYRSTISASSYCTDDYYWSVTSGSLPPGLIIDPRDGSIFTYVSGTPAIAGTYTFTVKVASAANQKDTASKSFSLTIGAAPAPGVLSIITTSLPDGFPGTTYPAAIISTAGTACIPSACCGSTCGWTWSITSGSLPPGLNIEQISFCTNGDHTYLYGIPTTAGKYTFTVQVTDCRGAVASQTFTVTIRKGVRQTGNTNVKVCAGDYFINCKDTSGTKPGVAPCSASDTTRCVLKTGIVDQFWPQARFGVMNFNKSGGVAVTVVPECIQSCTSLPTTDSQYCPYPSSNFDTAIENAVPITFSTPLVDGEWEAMHYYATGSGNGGYCDPFANSASCMKNFVLMITGGLGADQLNANPPSSNPSWSQPNPLIDNTHCSAATYKLSKNSCFGYNNDLRSDYGGTQNVSTYIVNIMGSNRLITDDAAAQGGGKDYYVDNPTELKAELIQAFKDIIARAASGTAASVLASGEGSGANLVQAVFYPRRKFFNSQKGTYDEIDWIGRLSNFWYYIDPFFTNSQIREDAGNKILDLKTASVASTPSDYIVQLYYNSTAQATMAHRWTDTNGDGSAETELTPDVPFESLGNLWEAGLELWKRDASTRTIFTTTDGSTLTNFSTSNGSTLQPYLQAADANESQAIISYVSGVDNPDYRPRSVKLDLNNDGNTTDTNVGGYDETVARVWKLGDVLNSTPKIASWIPINSYDKTYGDASYGGSGGYIHSSGYQNRGVVFSGANDGMLHAFYLGKLELSGSWQDTSTKKAKLSDPSAIGYGKELWSFIPKNALPYLRYQADPNYCHVYTIDLAPYIFDASIGTDGCSESDYWNCSKYDSDGNPIISRWKTIVIGGMRFGGACKKTCPDPAVDPNCVQTPTADPANNANGLGYSSYFALDVTDFLAHQNDPVNHPPVLLWEFSNENLGYSTTGPAIVRINARNAANTPDKTKNGRWFMVVGSGPTGPIHTDPLSQQFMGSSDQNLRLFVIDLATGALATTQPIDTGITNAFAGSMINATHDVERKYEDNIVYVPYVRLDSSTWTQGGVGRLVTKMATEGTDTSATGNTPLNPGNWTWSKVIDGVGPVTSSVVRLQDPNKGQLWLYFGTGRYYYVESSGVDDPTGQRRIVGMKEPCYSGVFDASCTTNYTSLSGLTNVTDVTVTTSSSFNPDAASFKGWYINLDPAGSYSYLEGNPASSVTSNYKAEREITDPLASTSGLVLFTTFKPYEDICSLGGKSFIWAVKYNSGGAPGALLKGKALIQVSTGAIEQIDMSTAFTDAGNRKSASMEGVSPFNQGLSLLGTPPPVKRVIHMRER